MRTYWVNIYVHPRVGEFEGNQHPTKEMADAAADSVLHELEIEKDTRLVRQEERGKAAMRTDWVNIYVHPRVEGEFEGNQHPTKEMADAAADHELEIEKDTRLVRQEERAWRKRSSDPQES